MTLRRSLPFATFAVLVLLAPPASANGAVGVGALVQVWALILGALALVVAAVLGILSWVTVLGPPKRVGWVFGRGFLAVSAIMAFALGGVCITLGLGSTSGSTSSWFGLLVVVATLAFFAIEFAIAGTLYRRSNAHHPSNVAQWLSIASYVLAGLAAVSTVLVLILGAFAQIISSDLGPSKRVALTAETLGYQKGCEAGVGSDCN